MYKYILSFLISMVVSCASAQMRPAEGAKLNYTQVMFEYEKVSGADSYLLELTYDTATASFDQPLRVQRDPATATLISGLEFGRRYRWRYAGIVAGRQTEWRGPFHFSIVKDMLQNLDLFVTTVSVNDSGRHAGGLIINDGTATIMDRSGRMVWYLSQVKWQFSAFKKLQEQDSLLEVVQSLDIKPAVMDMRLTPFGTITLLTDSTVMECDIDGNILWRKKMIDQSPELGEDNYNHAFMRRPDGHYMTLGKQVWMRIDDLRDTACTDHYKRKIINGDYYRRVEFGTVLEYNQQGKLIWSWNSRSYFDPYGTAGPESSPELNSHVNALSVDRENKFVYVGFRDISRIVKIEKSTGHVVDSWGGPSYWGVGAVHRLDVHQQHDGTILDDGTILVYNNNDYPHEDSIPSVVIFSQQASDSGRILWRYDYDLPPALRRRGRIGGNADQLRNGNILVCTGSSERIFEVTMDKKIVWQAVIMPKDLGGYVYTHRLYRAHCVSSLYPCYFVFQTDRDTIGYDSPSFTIRLYNKGSEEDAYDVKITTESGKLLEHFTTTAFDPNSSAPYEIYPDPLPKGTKILISIHSQTNPDLERRAEVIYQK